MIKFLHSLISLICFKEIDAQSLKNWSFTPLQEIFLMNLTRVLRDLTLESFTHAGQFCFEICSKKREGAFYPSIRLRIYMPRSISSKSLQFIDNASYKSGLKLTLGTSLVHLNKTTDICSATYVCLLMAAKWRAVNPRSSLSFNRYGQFERYSKQPREPFLAAIWRGVLSFTSRSFKRPSPLMSCSRISKI